MFGPYTVETPDFKTAPVHTGGSLRWILYFLKPHWKLFSLLSANRITRTIFFAGVQPLILAKIVGVLESGQATQNPDQILNWLGLLVGLASIVFFLLLVCVEEAKLRERVGRGARLLGLAHLNRLSVSWHEGNDSGGKLQKIMTGSIGLSRLIGAYFMSLLTLFANIVGTVISFIGIGLPPFYLLLIIGFASTYILFAMWSGTRVAHGYDKMNDLLERLVGKVYEFVEATPMVKSFNLERHILDRAQLGEQEGYEHAGRVYRLDYVRWIAMNFIGLGWFVLVIYLTATQVMNKEIQIAAFVLAVYTTSRLWDNLENFNELYDTLLENNSAFKRLIDVLRQEARREALNPAPSLKVKAGTIRFNNIRFAYNRQAVVFKELSLHINAGEKVGIVGASGAGKSTLVKLLLRFYDPEENEILIDDQNIGDVCKQSLRQQIAVIPQDVNLFNHSVLDNIRYGRLDATDEDVMTAARQADAEDFILKLPQGYDTLVGERGLKLSGGQRQRIAIARAFLKNAPILILDEATSALDVATERTIQARMQKLMEGRTVIVIAHRLSTLAHMNRLIVLDHGRIVEEGSHEELLRRDGAYAKLWRMHASGTSMI